MKKIFMITFLIVVFSMIMPDYSQNRRTYSASFKGGFMELKSVFLNNERIPSKYTCDGENSGPELYVSGVPSNAKSLVLIIDDPDAPMGLFTHYVLFNIPVDTSKLLPSQPPKSAIEARNDFGQNAYGGPCPPNGTHRYFFKIFALDKTINLQTGVVRQKVDDEMRGHVLEDAQLIGLYARH